MDRINLQKDVDGVIVIGSFELAWGMWNQKYFLSNAHTRTALSLGVTGPYADGILIQAGQVRGFHAYILTNYSAAELNGRLLRWVIMFLYFSFSVLSIIIYGFIFKDVNMFLKTTKTTQCQIEKNM